MAGKEQLQAPKPQGIVDRALDVGDGFTKLTLGIEVAAIGVGLAVPPLAPFAAIGAGAAVVDGGQKYAIDSIKDDRKKAKARRTYSSHMSMDSRGQGVLRRDATDKMRVEVTKEVDMKAGEEYALTRK